MFVAKVCLPYFALCLLAAALSAQQPGGYREILTSDKEVAKAATFAVEAKSKADKEKIKLVKIVKAEVQIVAGRNFRLALEVATNVEPRRQATVVVWAKLDGTMELTNWEWRPDAKKEVKPKSK